MNYAIYRCSKCNGIVSKDASRCPLCNVLLAGIRCNNCHYVGASHDFILDKYPKCGSFSINSFGSVDYTTNSRNTNIKKEDENKAIRISEILLTFFIGLFSGIAGIVLSIWIEAVFFGLVGVAFTIAFIYMAFIQLSQIKECGWRW